ncbi:MAG: DUF4912 domain-containing protein [Nitrospirota bacterium]
MERADLAALTVAQLKDLAKKKRVAVPSSAKKAEIIRILMGFFSNNPKKKNIEKQDAKAAKKKTIKKQLDEKIKKVPLPKPIPETQQTESTEYVSMLCEWKTVPNEEEPFMIQERRECQAPAKTIPPDDGLPKGYDVDAITLLSRDPFVVYAYWEVTRKKLERALIEKGGSLCIRMYDITGVVFDGSNAVGYFDQPVTTPIGSWYFTLDRPGRTFCADIGLCMADGRFLTCARSNAIAMPRQSFSDVDEAWAMNEEEFMRIYDIPGGLSSASLRELLKRRQLSGMSSPGLFSPTRPRQR